MEARRFPKQISRERGLFQEREAQLERRMEASVVSEYGLVTDISASICRMPSGCWRTPLLDNTSTLPPIFHLTIWRQAIRYLQLPRSSWIWGKSLPPSLQLQLQGNKSAESFEIFQLSLSWYIVLFGDVDQDFVKYKFHLKSLWVPLLPPPLIDKKLRQARVEPKNCFHNGNKLRVPSNFSGYHNHSFKRLRGQTSVVFANADNNLGHVAVLLSKYIAGGLIHLQDCTTYILLSREDDIQHHTDFRKAIQECLQHGIGS